MASRLGLNGSLCSSLDLNGLRNVEDLGRPHSWASLASSSKGASLLLLVVLEYWKVVIPPEDVVAKGVKLWNYSLVGQFVEG